MDTGAARGTTEENQMTDNKLPPELTAQQKLIDMVFGEFLSKAQAHTAKMKKQMDVHSIEPPIEQRNSLNIEEAIMHCAPFDYITAGDIFAALHRRLELRYENMSPTLETIMNDLAKALDKAAYYEE